ncbi:HEXXH motif-containing putative peptide modification protein [Kitasatospora sp. NPDC059795]|uniref:aKG-HExxH-type peptide beta-hydroxylase n=1 Tax=Kitasatospora sp. NPDC059795 TaxID=3346949 RepID=UPI00365292B2
MATLTLTRRLPGVLRWGPGMSEVVAVALHSHLRVVQDGLAPLLPKLPRTQLGELARLDDLAWHRLLADPSAFGLLKGGLGRAEPAADVEALLERVRARPGLRVHGIEVDTSSRRTAPVFARVDAAFNGASDYGGAELGQLERLLGATLTAAASNEHVETLITGCVRVISMRREASRAPSSSSWPSLPGYIRLWNAEQGDLALRVDAVIHEAVHCLLYMIEEQENWFTDQAAAWGSSMRSLWSGRDLPLHSFVHACFVWFALTCFWAEARVEGADDMFRRAATGFDGGRLPAVVRSMRAVDVGVREVLLDLAAQAEEVLARRATRLREPVR